MFKIHGFDDFCLWMYVMIDDWCQQQPHLFQRPGPAPTTSSDSELLTMVLVGECQGWAVETDLWHFWTTRRDLFPRLPSRSRFHRRRVQLADSLLRLHGWLVAQLGWAEDRLLLLDSVPLAVVSRAHAAHASSDWTIHQAAYGYAPTKRWPFFGYRLHVLATCSGVILDWVLVSASVSDVAASEDLLQQTPVQLAGRTILADKGYTSARVRQAVRLSRAVHLWVLPKRGMKAAGKLPLVVRRTFARLRQRIETLNSQLALQFGIEQTTAHSFQGLVVRLRAKLTAHVLCVYGQWQAGVPLDEALQIKHLVFAS